MARPLPRSDSARRTTLLVLVVGGVLVLALIGVGTLVSVRKPEPPAPSAPVTVALATGAPSSLPRLEPSALLAEARRLASAWHADAVLVSLTAGPLDASGVITGGKVELTYAQPSGQRVSGGANVGAERLILSATGGPLSAREARAGKARIAPEPNCLFEDAWAAAQRAGADAQAALSLRYTWSEKQERPVWEVLGSDSQLQRRLDGVSCSILTR